MFQCSSINIDLVVWLVVCMYGWMMVGIYFLYRSLICTVRVVNVSVRMWMWLRHKVRKLTLHTNFY